MKYIYLLPQLKYGNTENCNCHVNENVIMPRVSRTIDHDCMFCLQIITVQIVLYILWRFEFVSN